MNLLHHFICQLTMTTIVQEAQHLCTLKTGNPRVRKTLYSPQNTYSCSIGGGGIE